ncbi:hypothetical protein E3P84_02458 [Wallemia ichthyophaga]|nr:hypothetical protein E3P84_02458 [Wallemia ichthyophaga]TIB40588.1 hypothetical protein E3P83_02813 [Wallemia ichthyophaga]
MISTRCLRKSATGSDKWGLSLEHVITFTSYASQFLLKSKSISLYRKAIRGTRGGLDSNGDDGDTLTHPFYPGIPYQQARSETLQWLRSDFQRNAMESDVERIKHRLECMQREIKNNLPNYDWSMCPEGGFPRFWR